jgi:hypothetical protein
MCARCDEIDERIARYRWIREQIWDQQVHDATLQLVAKLETEKQTLHPEQ